MSSPPPSEPLYKPYTCIDVSVMHRSSSRNGFLVTAANDRGISRSANLWRTCPMTTAHLSAISPLSSHDHRDASIGGVLVWMDWFSGVYRTDTNLQVTNVVAQ